MCFISYLKLKIVLQRIQTAYLLATVLCGLVLFAYTSGIEVFGSIFVVKGLAVISALLSAITIFSFKNRTRQILFNYLNIFINALLVSLLVYWMLNLSGGIHFPEKGIEPVFPSISIICLFLANKNIRKDERLVKSVDRLR